MEDAFTLVESSFCGSKGPSVDIDVEGTPWRNIVSSMPRCVMVKSEAAHVVLQDLRRRYAKGQDKRKTSTSVSTEDIPSYDERIRAVQVESALLYYDFVVG